MPELPEVETLKRELSRVLAGKKIKNFESEKFRLDLTGKKIIGIDRRAKILIFKLSGQEYLLIHLKMTGQLVYKNIIGGHPNPPAGGPIKYTRAIFTFTDNSKLLFNDLRRFGWIRLASETELQKIMSGTGVEPLGKDFTLEKFTEILTRFPKRKTKQLLLDQTLIAGLGNIYADESCFLAGILPTRVIGSLTSSEIKKLHQGIIEVLKLSIQKKGTSSRNYVRSNGKAGGMVPFLNVYGREGKLCKRCNKSSTFAKASVDAPIVAKIKLNGRGTHFCPHCQN